MSQREAASRAGLIKLAIAVVLGFAQLVVVWLALHPDVSDEYRAYYIDHTRSCWLSPSQPVQTYLADLPRSQPVSGLNFLSACAVLSLGWRRIEDWGVWSTGTISRVRVPYDTDTKAISLTLRAPPLLPAPQRVLIRVDSLPSVDVEIPPGAIREVSLPRPAPPSGVAQIEIDVLPPLSPKQAGQSNGKRRIGIGLVRIDH